MHIKDHNDAMTFFRNSKQLESNGKWKEFVDEMEFESMLQEPRTMAQEPRIGLQGGQLVQPGLEGVRQGYDGRGKYIRSTPLAASENKFTQLDDLIKNTNLTKEQIKIKLGAKKGTGYENFNNLLKAWEASSKDRVIPQERFKVFKFTKDSPKVKKVIDLFESGMSKRAIEFKTGISSKQIRRIFHKFAPEYIGEANAPTGKGKWNYKKIRAKIIKELKEELKGMKNGDKILKEMTEKLDGIWAKNNEIANMSDEAILNNKTFKEAMGLDVKGLKAGEGINFNRYADLTPEEYVAKIRAMAKNKTFFQPEHFIAINKKNVQSLFPKNIYTATGKMGGQLETLKNYVINNPKGDYVSQIDELFTSQGLPTSERIRGTVELSAAGDKKAVDFITKTLKNKGVPINERGFIATAMLEDFGKLGLKGGKLLRWLQLEYDVLFESLIYQYHRQYKGQEPGLAREALWLPKIIAKYAPDLWKKAGFKPFETGVWEGPDTVLEKRLYEIRGTEKENLEKVIGVKKPVKNYIDNQKRMEEISSEWDELDRRKKGSSRVQLIPEQLENFENQQAALTEEYNQLDQLNKPDSLSGYHTAYKTALEAQETEEGVKATEAHKERLGVDEERLDELDELFFTERDKMKHARTFGQEKLEANKLKRAQERFEDEQADKRRKAVEDKYPTLTKSEVDKKLEDVGLYMDINLRSYKGQTVKRPKGLKYIGKPAFKPDSKRGMSYDDVRDYWKDLDKQSYYADNFKMEKAEGGIMSLKKK